MLELDSVDDLVKLASRETSVRLNSAVSYICFYTAQERPLGRRPTCVVSNRPMQTPRQLFR